MECHFIKLMIFIKISYFYQEIKKEPNQLLRFALGCPKQKNYFPNDYNLLTLTDLAYLT